MSLRHRHPRSSGAAAVDCGSATLWLLSYSVLCPIPSPLPSPLYQSRRDHAVMARSLLQSFSVSIPFCPGKKKRERLEWMFSTLKSTVRKLNHVRFIRNKNKHEEKLNLISSEISLWTFAICFKVTALNKQKQTKHSQEPQFEAQRLRDANWKVWEEESSKLDLSKVFASLCFKCLMSSEELSIRGRSLKLKIKKVSGWRMLHHCHPRHS